MQNFGLCLAFDRPLRAGRGLTARFFRATAVRDKFAVRYLYFNVCLEIYNNVSPCAPSVLIMVDKNEAITAAQPNCQDILLRHRSSVARCFASLTKQFFANVRG